MRYPLIKITSAILLLLVAATGCSSSNNTTPEPGDVGWIIVTAYMPYVEDVIIPDTIYADEDFTLTMRVSSALEPRLLNGDMHHKVFVVGPAVNPTQPQVIRFPMWLKEDLPPGPAPNAVEFEYPADVPLRLPAGEWYIGVQTAKTRELGGVCVEHAKLDYLSSWDENYVDSETGRTNFVEYRLYPVTVVERPGA